MSSYEREYKHNGYSQFIQVAGLGDGEDTWDTSVKANAVVPVQQASPYAIFGTIASAVKQIGKPAPIMQTAVLPGVVPTPAPKAGLPIVPIALAVGGIGLIWWLKKGK